MPPSSSDGHDLIASPLTTFFSPTHPLHQTFIALSLVTLCLLGFFANSIPPWVVLLPVGWIPLLAGLMCVASFASLVDRVAQADLALLSPPSQSIPLPPPALAPYLHTLHVAVLDDRIPQHLLAAPRTEVSVWESQRFGGPSAAAGSKDGWEESTWGGREVGSTLAGGETVHGLREVEVGPKGVWGWMPGEEWFVDRVGGWTEGAVDGDGWSHLNAHHQVVKTLGGVEVAEMEVGSVRRRRWWRRSVRTDGQTVDDA
jgi:hypothetical protein